MAKIKTFTNGGTLLPGDLNNMEEDYEGAYGFKKHLLAESTLLQAPAAGTFVLGAGSSGVGVERTGELAGLSAFFLNPADYAESTVNVRTVKLNLQATCITNAVAPATTLTVGLYPVSAAAGAVKKVELTLGAVVAGSTCAFTTPAKETLTQVGSGLFVCPASGFYAIAVVVAGATAASSAQSLRGELQLSQI